MSDLFGEFDINIKNTSSFKGQPVGEKKVIDSTPKITDMDFLRNYEQLSRKTRQSDFFQNLSLSYLNRCYEISQNKGSFTYVCIRCFKPIMNHRKLVEEYHSHLLYGRNCYSAIHRRQSNLVYQWEDGIPIYQTQAELQIFECTSCGRKFPALFHNTKYCGTNSRCCFCCGYNTLKYKGIACPFEYAFGIKFKAKRSC